MVSRSFIRNEDVCLGHSQQVVLQKAETARTLFTKKEHTYMCESLRCYIEQKVSNTNEYISGNFTYNKFKSRQKTISMLMEVRIVVTLGVRVRF